MASISITIPDAEVNRALDAVALIRGYVAGSEKKAQFARRQVAETVKDWVIRGEAEAAAIIARASAAAISVT